MSTKLRLAAATLALALAAPAAAQVRDGRARAFIQRFGFTAGVYRIDNVRVE